MKNQTAVLLKECPTEQKAQNAIQHIQQWIDQRYPSLTSLTKSRLILECLIELSEERKFLTPQAIS